MQPYSGMGNPKLHGLAVLHQLSNRDKHRALNPMLVSTSYITWHGTVLEAPGARELDWEFMASGKNLKVGTELMKARLPSDVDDEVEVAGYAFPNIKLPQGNADILRGVCIMFNLVESIVSEFVRLYGV
ncbi:MAG: hypothetical protein JOZ19_05820 [Rubrobacter sp.]|nr:hypothetical protein [Rubrobacter sp.]